MGRLRGLATLTLLFQATNNTNVPLPHMSMNTRLSFLRLTPSPRSSTSTIQLARSRQCQSPD